MRHVSPIRELLEAPPMSRERAPAPDASRPGAATGRIAAHAHAEFIPYGSPASENASEPMCELLATLGEIELEYAAIRRTAALFDAPHRGTLVIAGADRCDFLNRMLTQDLRHFTAGSVAQSFWLNRTGRIDADLTIAEIGSEILIDLDIVSADATATALEHFVFSEDVQVRGVSDELHRIQLHGPEAHAMLASAIGGAVPALENMRAARCEFGGAPVTIFRNDIAAAPGFHITLQRDRAAALWLALAGVGARPIGWYALNIARIEAGTPMFNIDFGSTNLPHESGEVSSRVSFKKGCYIGQEIVARMQNLGAPKQQLVGLAMQSDHLPVAGGAVFEVVDNRPGDRVGVVTSSTISPMCSAQPIAFAMLRSPFTQPGTELIVHAEGEEARAQAHPLTFWTSPGAPT